MITLAIIISTIDYYLFLWVDCTSAGNRENLKAGSQILLMQSAFDGELGLQV